MVTLSTFVAFLTLVGQIFAGDFVGKVTVTYDVFAVFEHGRFKLKCTATHEDKKPQLRWFFINQKFVRSNLTSFSGGSGSGRTQTRTHTEYDANFRDTGDYFCEAKVDNQFQKSAGVPIFVLEEKNKPRVKITKSLKAGKILLTCTVVPQGRGDLMWRKDGDRIKYEKSVDNLELDPTTKGEYECYGNLTIGGFKFFRSSAYARAAAGWSKLTAKAVFLPTVVCCLFTLVNSLSFL